MYAHPWHSFDPTHWNVYEHGLGYMSTYGMSHNYRLVQKGPGKRQFEFRHVHGTLV